MKFWVAVLGVVGMGFGMAAAQVPARTAPATVAACGVMSQNFSVTEGASPKTGEQVPEGKALVYLLEDIRHTPFNTVNFRVGVDGKWLGATRDKTYLSFAVEPGEHHLCVDVQGHAWGQLEKGITLRRLNVEEGKTYYLRARMVWGKNTLPLIFVEPVDEDEGQLLLQTSVPAVWHAK